MRDGVRQQLRAPRVEDSNGGMNDHRGDRRASTGSRTARDRVRRRRSRRSSARRAGRRHVVRVALDLAGQLRARVVVEQRRSPPSTSARASSTPATIAAADEPRPRPCGIRLAQTSSSPRGWPPSASKVGAHRPHDQVPLVARRRRSAPSPATSTVDRSSATRTTTSSYRPSARPSASKPGPEVGAGGGHPDLAAGAAAERRPAAPALSQPVRAATAAACASTGTVIGVGRAGDRPLRVLQAVPVTVQTTRRARPAAARPRRSCSSPATLAARRRLDEDALARGPAAGTPTRISPVGDRVDQAAGLVAGVDRLRPRRRVADPDRGGDRRRLERPAAPFTIGAAPAAWKPNIRGVASRCRRRRPRCSPSSTR